MRFPTMGMDKTVNRRQLLKLISASCLMLLQPEESGARVVVADRNAGEQVIKTTSGLQYYDFVTTEGSDGSGNAMQRVVSPGDMVRIEYTLGSTGARNGWRIDTGELNFRVGDGVVVKGLEEGVVGMKQGGRRRLLIPSTLGYVTNKEQPIPKGFAEFQRFKNLYLNPDRPYKPDVVFDVTMLKIRWRVTLKVWDLIPWIDNSPRYLR